MTRTHDLLITNQLLYRLSYTSDCCAIIAQSFYEVNRKSQDYYSLKSVTASYLTGKIKAAISIYLNLCPLKPAVNLGILPRRFVKKQLHNEKK